MKNLEKLFVFGSGGHSKVLIDAAQKCGLKIDAVFDDNECTHGKHVSQIPILGGRHCALKLAQRSQASKSQIIVAIGDNKIRKEFFALFSQNSINLWTIVHPSAVLADGVKVGDGSVVFSSSVINPNTVVGKNVIINTGVIIEHDCHIREHAHIAPGSVLCGNVDVGSGALVGAGSVVAPRIKIGKNAIVGAGSLVLSNVPDGVTVFGRPAKQKNDLAQHHEVDCL